MVLIVVSMQTVSAYRMHILELLNVSLNDCQRILIRRVVNGIGLWHAEDAAILHVFGSDQSDSAVSCVARVISSLSGNDQNSSPSWQKYSRPRLDFWPSGTIPGLQFLRVLNRPP